MRKNPRGARGRERIFLKETDEFEMLEYYEPRLDLSSSEQLNTIGVIVSLKDPVNGEILRSVIEELRVRFPYFYVKAA